MADLTGVRDHFLEQARWCTELGSPFTADLLGAFASDLDAGGPVATLCGDWPGNPRKDALALRLAGALHHGVLSGDAPALAALYPASAPGTPMAQVWRVARDWLAANIERVRAFLKGPPQTNETRRSIVLLPGFLELAHRFAMPMHLLEPGASAGLNQGWDVFSYDGGSWTRPGSSGVTIGTDWRGPQPPFLDAEPIIASRAACDLSPIDLSDPAQVLRLKSYVWADQADRLARLEGAIAVARERGVQVEQANAADWLEARLATRPDRGLTVVYHSVFLFYPPPDEIARFVGAIMAAGETATPEAPLAWLCYEPQALFGGESISSGFECRLTVWPGGEPRRLARSDGHITFVDFEGGQAGR